MQPIFYLILRRMRIPLIVLVLVYAVSVLGFVLVPGMDDNGQPWRMDFFHAFYFVSFMGSTIGFGEIPYAFTNNQRMWTLFTIYGTVVAWLYAIGRLIALLQSPMFQLAVTRNTFIKQVKKLRENFYLICGYGDAGRMIVEKLTAQGIRCIVVENNQNKINELTLESLPVEVPRLLGDAGDTTTLSIAGLENKNCKGVVAVTRNDDINLKISIASKLLRPHAKVYCWAESNETVDNLASFGTDFIVNPYDTFADFLATALGSPNKYILHQRLISSHKRNLIEHIHPPKGRWILCGYGRFGKAIYKRFLEQGLPVTVIEIRPDLTHPPDGTIVDTGTEADTLETAEIHKAVGIIAATDHDVNNLSILVTAKSLNPDIFTVARQESSSNKIIFDVAGFDMVTNHSELVISQFLTNIISPMTARFLELKDTQSEKWAEDLMSRILACAGPTNPYSFTISLGPDDAPGFYHQFKTGYKICLHHILSDPADRTLKLPLVPLLLSRKGEEILLPDEQIRIFPNDSILLSGPHWAKRKINRALNSSESMRYLLDGTHQPGGALLRWLVSQNHSNNKAADTPDR